MIIHSPLFDPEEFRTVYDVRNQLELVVKHFKLRAYVMRLTELMLTELWIEENDERYGRNCIVLSIGGTVEYGKTELTPKLLPPRWANRTPHSKVTEIVAREFGDSFESDFGGINGQIPQWAIDSLRIKLEILASKAEPVLT